MRRWRGFSSGFWREPGIFGVEAQEGRDLARESRRETEEDIAGDFLHQASLSVNAACVAAEEARWASELAWSAVDVDICSPLFCPDVHPRRSPQTTVKSNELRVNHPNNQTTKTNKRADTESSTSLHRVLLRQQYRVQFDPSRWVCRACTVIRVLAFDSLCVLTSNHAQNAQKRGDFSSHYLPFPSYHLPRKQSVFSWTIKVYRWDISTSVGISD